MTAPIRVWTPWQKHVERWETGCGSELCASANKVCLARGTIPADIVFVGEAPGASEDCLGKPFVGPAGQLLDKIIERGFAATQVPGTEGARYNSLTWAFTNLVGCLPRDPEQGGKLAEPPDAAIKKCAPRLQELVRLCDPKLIVCVGRLSSTWLNVRMKAHIAFHKRIPQVDILHPAFILRMPTAARGLTVQKIVIQLRDAVQDHLVDGKIPPPVSDIPF